MNDKRESGESVFAFTYVDFESVIVRSLGIYLENAMLRSMAILAVTLGFGAALADDFNYNYIDAGYARGKVRGDTGGGLAVGGSFAVADNWHLFAGYQGLGFDSNVDLKSLQFGAGINTPISPAIDVFARVAFIVAEAGTTGLSVNDNGFGAEVGLRAHASDAVELNAAVTFSDVGDGGTDTALGAGFLFNINTQFAVGLSASWDGDVNAYLLGGRFYF